MYDGEPSWNEIRIEDENGQDNYDLGILSLTGLEKIFPVDVFFRPVSLIPFTKALVRIKEKENLDYENLIRKFPSSVFWIQNDIWKKIIWDDVKKSMIMGNSKLIELIFLYSYDNSFLTESEKKKIVKELESKWDYHESDIIEIFEQRLLGENI